MWSDPGSGGKGARASRGQTQYLFGFAFHVFFSLSCFLAERTVILLVDFLVLLHPSVLQSVLGGWSHGAEL